WRRSCCDRNARTSGEKPCQPHRAVLAKSVEWIACSVAFACRPGALFPERSGYSLIAQVENVAHNRGAMLAYYLHSLDPIIFRIYDNVGPRWYGLAYVLAFISSYLLFLWLAKHGYADLPPQRVGDFITGCALFGVIVGGRLGYVFFYKPEMLREPLSI